jgi:hypothetical protein
MPTVLDRYTIPPTAENIKALDLVDKVARVNDEAFDDADMFTTNLVEQQLYMSTEMIR